MLAEPNHEDPQKTGNVPAHLLGGITGDHSGHQVEGTGGLVNLDGGFELAGEKGLPVPLADLVPEEIPGLPASDKPEQNGQQGGENFPLHRPSPPACGR